MLSEKHEESGICGVCRSSIHNDSNILMPPSPRIIMRQNVGGVPDVELNLGDEPLLVDDTSLEVSCLNLAE